VGHLVDRAFRAVCDRSDLHADPRCGSPPSPTRCARSRRSIASSTTPTTWSSTASRTASGRSRRWTCHPHRTQRRPRGEPGAASATYAAS